MLNDKVIIMCGYAHGGTNNVWNILQSHPKICSPIYETGQLFNHRLLKLAKLMYRKDMKLHAPIVDRYLYYYKLKNYKNLNNRFIEEGILYTKQQIKQSSLCLKSVNDDITLTDLLLGVYPEAYFIFLTRNGYALADGYLRRGLSAVEAGVVYNRIATLAKEYEHKVANYMTVKFEDVLQNPFHMAEKLFHFVNIEPYKISKIRLKVKRIIANDNEHKARYGNENKKYWFDDQSIGQLLNPDINKVQISRLSAEDIKSFSQEAHFALDYFNYDILNGD